MRVLVACEWSGTVRDAFRARGHFAVSADLESSAAPGPHFQGNALDILDGSHGWGAWDMLIAFPPCTHLANSGARWMAGKREDGRQAAGIELFLTLAECNIPRVAIENPVGIMSRLWRKPDQIVQPFQFGDPFRKTTCLWLRGLPLLQPTCEVEPGPQHVTKSGRSMPAWYNIPPRPDRGKIRGKTFEGIARAMAEQWG